MFALLFLFQYFHYKLHLFAKPSTNMFSYNICEQLQMSENVF